MKTARTEQQRHAIESAGSVVLSAGAGSGKTSVLVDRYLRHLDTLDIRNLAAITFTERAAREMRKRIRAEIDTRAKSAGAGSAEAIRWQTHRQNLDAAAIDTIHGFCTRLLRRFATVLTIDPAFTVMDALFTAPLRDEVLESELQTILLGKGALTDDLNELVVLFGWNTVVNAVDGFLTEPDTEAWKAFVERSPESLAEDWRAFANVKVLPHYAAKLLAKQPTLSNLDRIVPATAEGKQIFEAVRWQLQTLATRPQDVDVVALRELASVKSAPKATKIYGAEIYEDIKSVYKTIREKVCDKFAEVSVIPPNLEQAAVVGQRMVRLALALQDAYQAKKRRAQQLDFHDLLSMTRSLLKEHVSVRELLQKQYRVLLLDELQDIDPVQMEIVDLLLGDAKWKGGLFAVGDAKQSIYRFRGADVTLFQKLRDEAPADSRQELTTNFRSVPGILRFVNALCSVWFPDEAKLEPFHIEAAEPCVEFLWTVSPEDCEDNAEALRQREAKAVARRILELTDGPTPRAKRHEIVLLFRVMTDVAIYEMALLDAGIDYYLVGGRAFFAQQEVYDLFNLLSALENPFDSLALAGVLRSPFCGLSDDAVHAVAMHPESVWDGLHDAKLLGTVPADQRENATRAVRNLTAWRSVKDAVPIAGLLHRVMEESGYDAALLFEPLGERKLANLWKLQEIAREFDRTGTGLAEFVVRLSDLVQHQPKEEQAATLPEEAEHVVRLMSIHQAKGLEFPVVIVPDLARDSGGGSSPVVHWHREMKCALAGVPSDIPKDEIAAGNPYPDWPVKIGKRADAIADAEENRRVFYVACTRAERLLIISSGLEKGPPIEPAGPTMTDLADVYDLNTGQSLVPGGEPVCVQIV